MSPCAVLWSKEVMDMSDTEICVWMIGGNGEALWQLSFDWEAAGSVILRAGDPLVIGGRLGVCQGGNRLIDGVRTVLVVSDLGLEASMHALSTIAEVRNVRAGQPPHLWAAAARRRLGISPRDLLGAQS